MNKSPYRARTVLVVDDQEFVRNIVTTMLEKIGFGTIVTAIDGTAAMETVRKEMPDLIICDINMKPMDGLQFLQELRDSELSGSRTVPVIYLTGEANQNMVSRATELGCDLFLLKPVSPVKLQEKINQVFGAGDFNQNGNG